MHCITGAVGVANLDRREHECARVGTHQHSMVTRMHTCMAALHFLIVLVAFVALSTWRAVDVEVQRRNQIDAGQCCSTLEQPALPHRCCLHDGWDALCYLINANVLTTENSSTTRSSSQGRLLSLLLLDRVLWEVHTQIIQQQLTMSPEDLDLARQFCPVVYFDSKEQIRPMQIEEYVAASQLRHLETDQVLQRDLTDGIEAQLRDRSDIYMYYRANWRRMDAEDVQDVPFYVKVDHHVQHNGKTCTSILYMFFYPHDYGGLEVGGKRFGEHVSDLEHIRVLVTMDPGKEPALFRIHYAAHSFFEGRWLNPEQCAFFDKERKRVKAFAACNGHASYPQPGKYVRLFGIAPDKTDGRGRVWNANALVRSYPSELVHFKGKFSKEILNGPCQEWYNELEPEVTKVCRFTGGFVNMFAKRNGKVTALQVQPSPSGAHLQVHTVSSTADGPTGQQGSATLQSCSSTVAQRESIES